MLAEENLIGTPSSSSNEADCCRSARLSLFEKPVAYSDDPHSLLQRSSVSAVEQLILSKYSGIGYYNPKNKVYSRHEAISSCQTQPDLCNFIKSIARALDNLFQDRIDCPHIAVYDIMSCTFSYHLTDILSDCR